MKSIVLLVLLALIGCSADSPHHPMLVFKDSARTQAGKSASLDLVLNSSGLQIESLAPIVLNYRRIGIEFKECISLDEKYRVMFEQHDEKIMIGVAAFAVHSDSYLSDGPIVRCSFNTSEDFPGTFAVFLERVYAYLPDHSSIEVGRGNYGWIEVIS